MKIEIVQKELIVLQERIAVCRLPADAAIPDQASEASLWAAIRTKEELTLVLPETHVQPGWRTEASWRGLKVAGHLPFDTFGVIAGMSVPLAEARISIFIVSTFDTDYLLVREADLEEACDTLAGRGYKVHRQTR